MTNIVIAGIQIFCDRGKEAMLDKAEYYIKQAFRKCRDIDLVILPEQFYQMEEQHIIGESYGEEPHDMFENWLMYCAKRYHVNIIGGTCPVKMKKRGQEQRKIRNRCLIADRSGHLVGHYDKIHLFDAFGVKESDTFERGNELGLFDLDIGKVGVWICYDTRFPEISRALTEKGADILCVPAAFYRPNMDQWEVLLKAAAIYNVIPVAAVNQYGNLADGRGFFGRSMLVDPKGIITAGASDKEGYYMGEVNLEYTKECRRNNPELKNRRSDLYKKWI